MLDAYGIRFRDDHLLAAGGPAPDDATGAWELVPVRRGAVAPCPIDGVLHIEDATGVLRFREGWLAVRGAADPLVEIHADVTEEALAHPFLALPATLLNHWWGHLVLHAGAITGRAGAVAVLADKGMGKSTTMAAAAGRGIEVLTDDVLVLHDGEALRGPRSVDLRTDAAAHFAARSLGMVGERERFRIDLPDHRPSAPLAAVVELAWGDAVSLDPTPGAGRLDPLLRANALGPTAVHHQRVLDLLDRPSYRLTRPRTLASVDAVVAVLGELADAA